MRFIPVVAEGKAVDGGGDDVCWMGVGGLGRAGIFEGDWVSVCHSIPSLSNGGVGVGEASWTKSSEWKTSEGLGLGAS